MPLTYAVYYLEDATSIYFAAVSCDLPPTRGTLDLTLPPYRNLPGTSNVTLAGSTNGFVVKTDLSTGAVTVSTGTSGGPAIVADDQVGMPYRQDPAFNTDTWIFTDSLGQLCGQFDVAQWPSWSNTPAPNCPVVTPIVAPH